MPFCYPSHCVIYAPIFNNAPNNICVKIFSLAWIFYSILPRLDIQRLNLFEGQKDVNSSTRKKGESEMR